MKCTHRGCGRIANPSETMDESLLDVDDIELAYRSMLPLVDDDALVEDGALTDDNVLQLGDVFQVCGAPADGDALVQGGALADCSMHLDDGGVHALEHIVRVLVELLIYGGLFSLGGS